MLPQIRTTQHHMLAVTVVVLAYTTATAAQNLSCICDLHHSLQQCRILNPLSEARDGTHFLLDASHVRYCWATMETPVGCLLNITLNKPWTWCRICAEGLVSRSGGSGYFIMWKTRHSYFRNLETRCLKLEKKKKSPVILLLRRHHCQNIGIYFVIWSSFLSCLYRFPLSLKKKKQKTKNRNSRRGSVVDESD